MRCPFCGHGGTRVRDSLPAEDNASIRRRWCCRACGGRFTTFERVRLRELTVVWSNGHPPSLRHHWQGWTGLAGRDDLNTNKDAAPVVLRRRRGAYRRPEGLRPI